MRMKSLLDSALIFGKKNLPEILTAVSVIGLVSTSVLAFKAGKKVDEVIKEKKQDLADVDPEDKEAKRTVMWEAAKEITPIIAPPVILGGVTIACILGSNRVSNKRLVIMSAAYSMSESAFKELNDKVEETIGKKKTRDIKDAIIKDKVDNMEIKHVPGDGNVICLDEYSGRTFRSTYQEIQSACNQLVYMAMGDMYVSLNDFYTILDNDDLPCIPLGEDFGWNVDDFGGGTCPIKMTSTLSKTGIPILVLTYEVRARVDYRNLH